MLQKSWFQKAESEKCTASAEMLLGFWWKNFKIDFQCEK